MVNKLVAHSHCTFISVECAGGQQWKWNFKTISRLVVIPTSNLFSNNSPACKPPTWQKQTNKVMMRMRWLAIIQWFVLSLKVLCLEVHLQRRQDEDDLRVMRILGHPACLAVWVARTVSTRSHHCGETVEIWRVEYSMTKSGNLYIAQILHHQNPSSHVWHRMKEVALNTGY